MKNNTGVIRFANYDVTKINYILNEEFGEREVSIDFDVSANFDIDESNTRMVVQLDVDVFKEAVANNYPFEMQISLKGYFINDSESALEDFRANAVAILFPYVRAIISTYTANANIAPLILPTINVNKLLKIHN